MSDELTAWIDADGVMTVLPVEWDVRGRFMPRIEVESDGVPGQPGERPRQVRHGVHEFILPLWLTDTAPEALRAQMRTIVRSLNPVGTDGVSPRLGKVRVQSVIGDVREIECLYAGGLEMDEKIDDSSGPTFQRAVVSFTAYDPYWYDPSSTSRTFSVTTVPSFFPIFPLKLTASEIVVDDTITNAGDVLAWPVWTITGPGSSIKLINLTTGEYIYFPSVTLGVGQKITIDTRPTAKTVLLDDGTNYYPFLDTASTLWALRPGVTSIRLEMTGTNPASSSLQVSYKQRYLSP